MLSCLKIETRLPPRPHSSKHLLTARIAARQVSCARPHSGSSTMRRSNAETRSRFAKLRSLAGSLALLAAAAGLLAGCETTGSTGPGPLAALSDKPAEPMTRARAATECWMKTEKSSAGADIDKRADIVTKCIDDKLKAAKATPKT